MADSTTTHSEETTTAAADLEWFRSSDQVGSTTIKGLNEGPDRFTFGEKIVTYSVVDGMPLFEGDILIDDLVDLTDADTAAPSDQPGDDVLHGVGITGDRFRWNNAIFPYQFASGFPHEARVDEAIEEISANTMIRFVRRTAANASEYPNYVEFFSGSGCFSSVGMRGGEQRISLGSGCGTRGIAIHEILHALGLWHEQSREDRANHVQVNLNNVIEGREHNFNQHIADGDDIGGYDFGSIMHYGRFAFSRNGLPTIEPLGGQAIGQRSGMSAGDINAVNELYPAALISGLCTIRQKSSGRYLDAHESSNNDFSLVTRTEQDNSTQRWQLTPVGVVATLRQVSSDRYMDAHESDTNDFSVVTRARQDNDTQLWIISRHPTQLGRHWIQQLSNGRFMDAHESSNNDFSVVTRPAQGNDTQAWNLLPVGDDRFELTQVSSRRLLDAHEASNNDFSVVTRTRQNNDTQSWRISPKGFVCTIQQQSNLRFVDAHTSDTNDFSVVTRTRQDNATQLWVVMPDTPDSFVIRHATNGRFMDAHESSGNDFSVVTRTRQNNDTQRWIIDEVD